MAEKTQQEYPFAVANAHPRSDMESHTADSDELKRQKKIKLAIYIAIFIVFQIIVMTVFGLTVMKVKPPKLRLSNIQFQTLNAATSSSPPSFDMRFATQVRVKNPNFGRYKFDGATADVTYDGASVGTIFIPKGKAGMKSTKKMSVMVNLSSSQLPNTTKLGGELSGGILTLTSTAKMSGKVELMLIMKKKKSAEMDCTITVDVAAKAVKALQCK